MLPLEIKLRFTQRAESVHSRMTANLLSSMLMLDCVKAYVWHMGISDDKEKVASALLRNDGPQHYS